MDDRIWEQSAKTVADNLLWGNVYYRWMGLMTDSAIGLIVGLLAYLVFDQAWLPSLALGIVVPVSAAVLLYGVGWAVCAPRKQRDSAKAHIDHLERKPSVSIGEPKSNFPPHDQIWRVPVTNLGPGTVSLFAKMTQARYWRGGNHVSQDIPVPYMRWTGGRGDVPPRKYDQESFQQDETKLLEVFVLTGLTDDGTAKEGRLVAANSKDDVYLPIYPASFLKLTIQVFGDPSLAAEAKREISIPIPPI